VKALAGDGQLVVTWPPPVDDDGVCTGACDAPVVGYTVTLEPADAGPLTVGADQLSVVVDGLTNGTVYMVSVVASNRIGDSAAATATATPQADGLTFTAIAAGDFHTCAIADGAVYCWGFGRFGRLGNGDTGGFRSLPVKVATDADSTLSALPADAEVTAISAGSFHTCAVAGGVASCWGFGSSGRLGNGATGDQTRPVAVLSPV
jgi:alpha-tubulin suppressor-like RCC1 family protein